MEMEGIDPSSRNSLRKYVYVCSPKIYAFGEVPVWRGWASFSPGTFLTARVPGRVGSQRSGFDGRSLGLTS